VSVPPPIRRRAGDAPWERLPVDGLAEVQTLLDGERSQSIGAGLSRFRDCGFEWRLSYDEVVYVLDGEIAIECGGDVIRGATGDVLLVPRGNTVTYSVDGECTVFFATYPVDWEDGGGG